jgi:hypothetical protein
MRFKIRLLVIIISAPIIVSCSIKRDAVKVMFSQHKTVNNDDINKKISVRKLHYDLDYFIKTIEDVGVDPFTNINKKDFYKEYELVKSHIKQPLTRREFYLKIAPLIGLLKHTHTHIWISPEFRNNYDRKNGKYIPLDVRIENGKLYVTKNYSTHQISEGEEIISLNKIDSKELVENLRRQIKSPTIKFGHKRVEEDFAFLLWWVYDFQGPFVIKFKDAELAVEGKSKSELSALRESNSTQEEVQSQSLTFKKIEPNIGLLKINTFASPRDEYLSFLKESFTKLKNDSIEFLIIYVRDNPGASDWQGVELIKYIWDKPFKAHSEFYRKKSRQKNRYASQILKWWIRWIPPIRTKHINEYFDDIDYQKALFGEIVTYEMPDETPKQNPIRFNGDVFVLINHNTYSAAAVFTTMIKDYKIASLVGGETGQCASADGELLPFDLPNSHWGCYAATTLGIRPNGDRRTDVGIAPDYEVKQTKARDDVFEFTMNLIKQKQ